MTKLSKRAETALDVLKRGGAFRYGLVTNDYTHRDQFKWSLHHGRKLSGFGGATYRELEKAGYTFRRVASGFTGSAAYYYLNPTEG